MFWHNFKYSFLVGLRNKSQILWCLIFPIALGSLFYAAFSNLYADDLIKDINVAAYIENEDINDSFTSIIENVTNDAGDKILQVTHTDSLDEAKKLLKDEKVDGVFYSEDGELRLLVGDTGLNESVLTSIAGQFHQMVSVMNEVSEKSPEQLNSILMSMMTAESKNTDVKTTDGNMDTYVQYFYNLLAMVCLFAMNTGILFAANNQGNLSNIGARKCVARTSGASATVAGLLAKLVIQFICALIGFGYMCLIGVNFGNKIGYIILLLLIGNMMGIGMGFCVGSIGSLSLNTKNAIGTSVSLIFCFLSGLMVGDIKMRIEEICPVLNKINPAAIICDAFYSLNIYDTNDRYFRNIVSMLIITVIFVAAGAIMGRRKKYASI